MRDFDLIVHQFYGGQDITIIPIADVHLGAAECMEQDFVKFTQWLKDEPNVYITLGGDLIDNGTKGSVTNPFRATMPPHQQKKEMANLLAPIRDRILCIVPGNHERRSGKDADDDPTYDIAAKLDLEDLYRESMAFIKIQMGKDRNYPGQYRPTYTLVVTHGSGGGIFTGGAVNRNERFGYVIDGMDVLITGHVHKPFTTQPMKIKIDPHNNQVIMQPFKVVSAASWLNYGGYAMQKMLLPSGFCSQSIRLSGTKKHILVSM